MTSREDLERAAVLAEMEAAGIVRREGEVYLSAIDRYSFSGDSEYMVEVKVHDVTEDKNEIPAEPQKPGQPILQMQTTPAPQFIALEADEVEPMSDED